MARARLGRFPSVEGQLVRLALEQEGIEVQVQGESLSVLQGVVPGAELTIELWVEPELLDRARRVLLLVLKENTPDMGDVLCPSCRLECPVNFEVCWNCQTELAGARRVATPAQPLKPRPPIFATLFACSTLVLVVLLWKERQLAKFHDARNQHWQWSGPSCLDLSVHGKRVSRSCDRNDDSNFETVDLFDSMGRVVSTSYDSDENGLFEMTNSFDTKGRLVERSFDLTP